MLTRPSLTAVDSPDAGDPGAPTDPFNFLVDLAIAETFPIGMHVDLTYRCDLACTHCYLESRKRDELTVEEYAAFFAELAEMGGLYLVFSGGDVFVRKDALDILWAASRRRFDISIITHGMAVTERVADELAEMGVRCLLVSVYHTDPEIHDRVTQRSGSFERTMAGVRRVLDRGLQVKFKTPVFEVNRGAERVVPELGRELGVEVQLSPFIRPGNDGTDQLSNLNVELESKSHVYRCMFGASATLDELAVLDPGDLTCLAAHASAYLGPDGTVQPCADYEQSCGNIRDTSFQEIWESSPLFQELRGIRRSSFAGCQSCENVSFCALCPARAARETGSPTGSAPSTCRESTAIRYAFKREESAREAETFDLFEYFGL